jgi:hypothetical protein
MEQESEKKERVIHTRVPPSLDVELKERAERLGTSVSNLVRNILHHAFGLAGDVIRDGHAIARSARGEEDGQPSHASSEPTNAAPTAEPAGRMIGWQAFVLGKNALCERCNAILPRGTNAHIAVLDGPGRRPIHCTPCVEELTRAND